LLSVSSTFFEFPISTSLLPSITLPRTRRQLIYTQNFFYMSMVHNNGSASGQGSKQWPCKICLRESFYRRQELDRHIQRFHLPCWLYCPYSRCEWRGCRIDELQKHLDHQRCNQNSTEREYQIYDVKTILDMIRDAESNDSIRIAQDWAVDFVRERARELGKQGWFMDPWGCLEQRERRERRASRR